MTENIFQEMLIKGTNSLLPPNILGGNVTTKSWVITVGVATADLLLCLQILMCEWMDKNSSCISWIKFEAVWTA